MISFGLQEPEVAMGLERLPDTNAGSAAGGADCIVQANDAQAQRGIHQAQTYPDVGQDAVAKLIDVG